METDIFCKTRDREREAIKCVKTTLFWLTSGETAYNDVPMDRGREMLKHIDLG